MDAKHHNVEATCDSCGESFLFAPPEGNRAYVEFCDCGGVIPVPADKDPS